MSAPWSYGKYDAGLDPTSFSPFTAYRLILGSLSEYYNGPDDPNIIKNIGTSHVLIYGIDFQPNTVDFGPYLGPAVARWTAPSAGIFQVDAVFATVQGINGAPDAYVYDATTLYDLGLVPAFGVDTVEYHQTLTLAADQSIDFVVWGGNKTTEVSATITQVPEPSLMLLLGIALGAVNLIGWRFKA
jgi:hypothetical protein